MHVRLVEETSCHSLAVRCKTGKVFIHTWDDGSTTSTARPGSSRHSYRIAWLIGGKQKPNHLYKPREASPSQTPVCKLRKSTTDDSEEIQKNAIKREVTQSVVVRSIKKAVTLSVVVRTNQEGSDAQHGREKKPRARQFQSEDRVFSVPSRRLLLYA